MLWSILARVCSSKNEHLRPMCAYISPANHFDIDPNGCLKRWVEWKWNDGMVAGREERKRKWRKFNRNKAKKRQNNNWFVVSTAVVMKTINEPWAELVAPLNRFHSIVYQMYTNTQYMAGTCGKLERHQNTLLTIWIVQRQQRIVIKTGIQNRGQCERMRKRRGRWNGKKNNNLQRNGMAKREIWFCVFISRLFSWAFHTHTHTFVLHINCGLLLWLVPLLCSFIGNTE